MAYHISKKSKRLPDNYYSDLEIQELHEKYKGKSIPFFEAERVATRRFVGIPKRIRQKNEIVDYKGEYAVVRKTNKKGIFVERFKVGKDKLAVPSGKLSFVSNEKAEHEIYPAFLPNWMIADLLV